MANRIQSVRLVDQRLNPAEAEIWLAVYPEQAADPFEVRGRLMGPRCPYAATVEIAYPLRPLPATVGGDAGFQVRALIPEPSLWEPQTPFLYFGPVELWQEGQCCDRVQVTHGLRTLHLGSQGVRVNGRPLSLHGVRQDALTETQARALHDRGVNLVLTDVRAETAEMWEMADRFGLLMLGRLRSVDDVRLALRLRGHASMLGWLLACELLRPPWVALAELRATGWIGAELEASPEALPAEVAFVVQPRTLSGPQAWPALVVGEPHEGAATRLGWIEE